ncbi:hypothetical protein [Leptolyngbya sp. KIOST-1]|uniref:hypothetical protein n=1 Tax=Leptolyngbya sp. KIOST-1 TaxID=1229172 RepID=UPI00068F8F64|nr:hypothetical protein [Leptolyngbya sp. KIOST-1]
MASSSPLSTSTATLTWGNHLQTNLGRLATAAAAVIGLSAIAGSAAGSAPALPNGTYLYGESPVADTIGAVYFVFEAREGHLSGAVYQPSSSFDCVRGTVANGGLDLIITDAYDQSETPYSIALVGDATVASASGAAAPAELDGLHAIAQLSSLDHQLLTACTNR